MRASWGVLAAGFWLPLLAAFEAQHEEDQNVDRTGANSGGRSASSPVVPVVPVAAARARH